MIGAAWWLLRSSLGYVASARYEDRKGLVVGWTSDATRALRFPTPDAARHVRRGARPAWLGEPLVVVRVTRREVHRRAGLNGHGHHHDAAGGGS